MVQTPNRNSTLPQQIPQQTRTMLIASTGEDEARTGWFSLVSAAFGFIREASTRLEFVVTGWQHDSLAPDSAVFVVAKVPTSSGDRGLT